MRKRLVVLGAFMILAIAVSPARGSHDSCRDNPSGQPFNVGTNDSYVVVPVTGGYVGVDLHGLDGSADACFASPGDDSRGVIRGERPELTETPGARVGLTACNHLDEDICFDTQYFGAEAGTTEGTTVAGSTLYGGMFLTRVVDKTGLEAGDQQIDPLTGVYIEGLTLFADGAPVDMLQPKTGYTLENTSGLTWIRFGANLYGPIFTSFPVDLDKTGIETSPSTNPTQGQTFTDTAAFVNGTRQPIADGETGVTFSPSLATLPTVDFELPPPTFGIAVCGTTVEVKRQGETELSQPVGIAAGSRSC